MKLSGYPVTEYYQDNVLDGETITRKGVWWTAVLLIQDPNSGKPFINFYRWQKVGDAWKTRKSFSIRNVAQVEQIMNILRKFAKELSNC